MSDLPYALQWFESVMDGNGPIRESTEAFAKTWRRSNKCIGGHWLGTCELKAAQVGREWLDDMFTFDLMREIRETAGGADTWRGALARMEYTRGGDVFVRDISTMANAIRSIYERVGANLLTNGSGESGIWTAYPSAHVNLTITQDSTWVLHGLFSIKVVVADTVIRGALVQTGITIVASVAYRLCGSLRVASGSWRIAVNRTDTDASLCFFSSGGRVGDLSFDVSIPENNAYAGTVLVRITSESVVGTVYVDNLIFQERPVRAETGWYTDTDSIAAFGRKEEILRRQTKTSDDANAECQSTLLDRAWPNPQPPRGGQTWLRMQQEDSLRMTFVGYWAMLNWLHTTLHGAGTCSSWVTALIGLQSAFIAAGQIDTNSLPYYVEDREPRKLGDLLREITLAGGSGGAKWSIGVYAGRQLDYESVPQTLSYIRRAGRLYNVAGGEMEPWLARPGWALWEDMPIGPGTITSNAQHDPRWVYLDEVEMLPGGTEIGFKVDQP